MAKKIKKYKVGIDSETYAISLVDEPAIEEEFVHLAKDKEPIEVKLSSEERHMVYGAVLVPEKDIYRNNGEQEFYVNFTKESIEKMSQDFMKEYRQKAVTLDHEEEANEVCVVESWLVEDTFRDKSNALGLTLPVGTWCVGMKVNNIETWDRIKSGELKGFSVESIISLEEFNKNDKNNIDMETNEMSFWTKMKDLLMETLRMSANEEVEEPQETEVIETEMEEQQPAEPVVETKPVTEPAPEPTPEPVEKPKVEDAVVVEEIKEEPKPNPLEELVKNLTDEIKSLKESNDNLQAQVKKLGKQPSTKPVNPQNKPDAKSTYAAWREQMAQML